MSLPSIIGIDFGTNKTLVARWDGERKEPAMVRLRPASGDDMPTFVHVNAEGHMVFGEEAGEQGIVDSRGFPTAFKRDLGRDTPPYLLHASEFSARQLVSAYLRWIREWVERESLHAAVEHAVFTVPAGWLPVQCEELLEAAKEAGFPSVEALDEPVAAGIAFMRSRSDLWPEGAAVVLDWGAGTLDLAVLTTRNGRPQIIPELVSGKAGLGGKDIDEHLMRMIDIRLAELKLPRLQRRKEEEHELVRRRVIEWKIKHSGRPGAVWRLDGLSDIPPEADLSWTSEKIAQCVTEKLNEAVKACAELLDLAHQRGVTPTGLLLIGGSSQFPAFRALLEARFPQLRVLPWEQRISAVALGAAWQAAGRMRLTEITEEFGEDVEVTLAANNPLQMNFVPVQITDGAKVVKTVYFGEYPIRVSDYDAFVKDTGRAWHAPTFVQKPDHPAVNVHWHDARAFCEWLSAKSKSLAIRFRLPTDHEWSCAAELGALEAANASPASKSVNPHAKGLYVWGHYWPPPFGTFVREERTPGVSFDEAAKAEFRNFTNVDDVSGYAAVGMLGGGGAVAFVLSLLLFVWSDTVKEAAKKEYHEAWFGVKKFMPLTSASSPFGTFLWIIGLFLILAAIAAVIACIMLILAASQRVTPTKVKAGIPNYPNLHSRTSPVGTHQANKLGLYDLSGNVWEWTHDAWPEASGERVLRGGAWNEYEPERIAAAHREHEPSTTQTETIGFRCVMERIAT